jgi:AP-3 complex subunit delta-1
LLLQIEKSDSQTYKDALVEKIVTICSKNSYAAITDFEWYISVLMEMAHVNTIHGELIASQLMDVIIRVQVVRPFGVKSMVCNYR